MGANFNEAAQSWRRLPTKVSHRSLNARAYESNLQQPHARTQATSIDTIVRHTYRCHS